MRNCIKSAPLTWTESYSSDVESIKHVGSKFRSTQLADINFTSWNMTETLNTTIRETIPTLCRALTLSSLTPTAQRTNSHTPVCRRSRQTTEWPNNSLPANPLPLYLPRSTAGPTLLPTLWQSGHAPLYIWSPTRRLNQTKAVIKDPLEGWRSIVSRFSARFRFGSSFFSKSVWFVDTILWLCPTQLMKF